jgi:phosphoribosylamine---glycine ligase
MRILLVSNSARGEAIADAFMRSPQKPELIVATTVKSPGLLKLAHETHVMDIMSMAKIVQLAKETKCSFAFVAPDDPIGAGLADRLEAAGIPCVAPKKTLARIEASKSFARELMKTYNIDGSPRFRVFTCPSLDQKRQTELDIRAYIEHELKGHYVVKYDALKGGKGVKVSGEHLMTIDMGAKYAMECINECGTVVVEEKLIGVEFSLMSFVSGAQVVDMPCVQDHKRANTGDTGPNTGGMGTYSDASHGLPFLEPEDVKAASEFNLKVAQALMTECGEPYKGVLYGGFIATAEGVRVIEYNARFGDPEALNVLPLLESDFVALCQGIIKGSLTPDLVRFSKKATVCKYIVPKSYPDAKKEAGQKVLLPEAFPDNVKVFYGDVTLDDSGNVLLGGSRSIGIVGIGESLSEAEQSAQTACEKVTGPIRFRADIGTVDSVQKRVDLMHKLRSH